MKLFSLLAFCFLCTQAYAEYTCTSYALSRSSGRASKSFKGHSDYGEYSACNKARDFCKRALLKNEKTNNFFCHDKSQVNFRYIGSGRPAVAYKNGREARRFGWTCFGKSNAEAKSYCNTKMMKACRTYVNAQTNNLSRDYHCSFL